MIIFILSSCSPRFTDSAPFIVTDVSNVCNGCDFCEYRDGRMYSIMAPCGMFNVGDTIKLTK